MVDSSKFHPLSQRLGGRSIYLVGMMGSGKSSTGPYLAKALGYSFIDQDKLIEEVSQMSISNIFSQEGESAFRSVETKVLKEIGQRHSLVVATGGGVVTQWENWGVLHQGIVVWINPMRDCLIERLKVDSTSRPLLQLNNQDSEVSLDSLIDERHSFYSEADLNVIVKRESPEEVASVILDKLPLILTAQEDPGESQTIAK